jgi:SlyX protein|tara:strand:- start:9689 stop:9934 length:246 start_codon:yes stop_codon:yes gene_type:complete
METAMTQNTPAVTSEADMERLETKLAFQEAALQSLNDALIAQQARIDHLERLTQALLERLRRDESGGTLSASQQHEPPPHY